MQINDILEKTGGLNAIARELGISETQAATGAAALIPAILGGFRKQAQAPAGLDGLGGLIGKLGGGALLDNVIGAQPTDVQPGNDVLGQIFGTKDVSRAVAQNAAGQSGLDPAVLKKMLPMLAMLVAGFMAKQRSSDQAVGTGQGGGGGLGGLLGGLLGGSSGGTGGGSGGGLGSLLDQDGDGNALDDILGMVAKKVR
jgi:hypothetical protein